MLYETQDILKEVYKEFPYIEEDSIEKVVKLYLRAINKELKKGEQIVISPGALPNGKRFEGTIRFRKNISSIDAVGILQKRHKNEKTTD